MTYSYHYLHKLVEKARDYLPRWMWRELVWAARAYAGGKSRALNLNKKYQSIDELPENVRKLPKKKQRQWMHVFNNAWERYDPEKHKAPSREAFAFAQAWAAVQKEDEEVLLFVKDSKRQIAYGIVYEPDRVDAQGDFMKPEAIEQACHDFMVRYRKGETQIKLRHEAPVEAYVVESYIAPSHFSVGGQDIPEGSWVMAIWIPDPRLWEAVEKGELVGFSMGGAILEGS